MSYQPPYGQPAYGQPGYGAQPYGAPPSAPYGAPPGQPPVSGYGVPPAPGFGAPPGAPNPYGAPGYGAAPMPPPGVPPDAYAWFQAVDQDRSGRISANELQNALLNGNNTQFKLETVRILMRLLDTNRNGTIDVNEFYGVLKYVNEWKATFARFDTDRSGFLGSNEVLNGLRSFGYQLSPQFVDMLVRVVGSRTRPGTLDLDGFILASVTLKSMTDKFSVHDRARNGTATLTYEQYLTTIFESVLI